MLYKDPGQSSLLHNIPEEHIAFELLGVCVLKVSVFALLNSVSVEHLRLADL